MDYSFKVYMRKEKDKQEKELADFRAKANKIIIPFFASSVAFFAFSMFKMVSVIVS